LFSAWCPELQDLGGSTGRPSNFAISSSSEVMLSVSFAAFWAATLPGALPISGGRLVFCCGKGGVGGIAAGAFGRRCASNGGAGRCGPGAGRTGGTARGGGGSGAPCGRFRASLTGIGRPSGGGGGPSASPNAWSSAARSGGGVAATGAAASWAGVVSSLGVWA